MTSTPSFRRVSGPYIPTSPSHDTLWRVMDLAKFRTLAEGGFWLARLDQFRTRYEGSLPDENVRGLLDMLPDDAVLWLDTQYNLTRDLRAYASTWHINANDPPAKLWAEFDPTGHGIAVKTTVSILRAEIAQTCDLGEPGRGPVHIGPVTYIDHTQDLIRNWNVLEAAFCVREKWAYQNELRVLISTHGSAAYEHLYNNSGHFGPVVAQLHRDDSMSGMTELVGGHLDGKALVLKVDAKKLIEEILPRPGGSNGDLWQTLSVAADYGLAGKVRVRGILGNAMKLAAHCRATSCGPRRPRTTA